MNHIYKSVWNTALGAWVAASELACGRGKSNSGTSKSKVLRPQGVGTLLLALGMSLGTNSVLAVTYEWNFASPGTSSDWGTPANWLLGIAPTASDAAHINNGGAASVSTSSTANVLQVGISTTGNQLLVDAGGTLATTQGVIGANAGSGGSVQGQGTWTNNGTITVGESGTGALTVSGAGSVSSADGFIGQFAGSSGTVNLSGSNPTWTITDGLNVGIRGTGYVRIWNGTLYISRESLAWRLRRADADQR